MTVKRMDNVGIVVEDIDRRHSHRARPTTRKADLPRESHGVTRASMKVQS
jgi:hypothetical protein